jgi:predicted MFS family arabinose efflux permease
MTSLGAPLLPSIAAATHVSLANAQWILTAALLAGGLATPIMGHLADGPRQRTVVLITLMILIAGSALAVFAPTFVILVVARGLQGVGFGVVPVTMAIARRHQSAAVAARTVATLSVTTAVGVGLGYPLSGLLDSEFGYRAAFWLGVGVATAALIMAARYLPRGGGRVEAAGLDLWSAVLMCVSLSGLLLLCSDGQQLGWTSPTVLVALPASLALVAVWIRRELRSSEPLVDFRVAAYRSVLTADISTLLVSASMYLYLPIVIDIVQSPPDHGVGLGESVLVAGFVLVPMSACTLAASLSFSRLVGLIGQHRMLPAGCLAFASTMVFFALAHNALWQAFVSMALLGVGCGLSWSAMPRMIVSAVAPGQTGHAMGLYQLLRSIGMALGSSLAGVLLGAFTPAGTALPTVGGYRAALLAGAALCVTTAIVSYVLPGATLSFRGRAKETTIAPAADLGGLS